MTYRPSVVSFLAVAPAATNAASTAPVVAVPPPSALRGKTIEEIVNKWSSDLEVHVREFNRYASEVAVWDRALIENGTNVRITISSFKIDLYKKSKTFVASCLV